MSWALSVTSQFSVIHFSILEVLTFSVSNNSVSSWKGEKIRMEQKMGGGANFQIEFQALYAWNSSGQYTTLRVI